MNRLSARGAGGLEQPVDVEIALGGHRRPDEVRFVCLGHVRRVAVGLRVHGDGLHAQLV